MAVSCRLDAVMHGWYIERTLQKDMDDERKMGTEPIGRLIRQIGVPMAGRGK